MSVLMQQIDAILPQTQCRECTYQDCQAYATAITKGDRIDRCKPGGVLILKKIAAIMQKDHTAFISKMSSPTAKIVTIKEADCIGCTKCIKACPVDAIIGAPKKMHNILKAECTGCNLCVSACPVDCIIKTSTLATYRPEIAKERYQQKSLRNNSNSNLFANISNDDAKVLATKNQYIKNIMQKKKHG